MTTGDFSLSIFFPCHNEQDNINHVTEEALQVARSTTTDFEIIIVNDGSTDRTAEIADELSALHPEVRVIHHPTNLGYGGALQSGFRAATKEWIFYTDGDGQFDIQEISKLLPLRGPQVIVSAFRLRRCDSAIRKLNAWSWCQLVNASFGLGLRDIDCAFKLYPANLFEQIELRSMGALIDTEIRAKAARLGYHIKQVGVGHLPRRAGRQSGASLKVIIRAFRELFALRQHIVETVPKAPAK